MNKNKILYVITSLGLGGAEKLLLYYISNLDKNKYSFHVCCLRTKPDDLLNEISKYAQITNLGEKNKFNPLIIFRLIRLIRSIKPDLIHTHLFQPRIYVSIAFLFYRRAVLITQKHNNVNPRKHNIFILLEMLSILINKKVIAISQSVKNSLIRYEFVPERKIYVLPNCIDYKNYHKITNRTGLESEKDIVIGVVGRLERQKGIKYLLRAIKNILLQYPNVKLEIIGDGTLLAELNELSSKLNISNSVKFFGKFADVKPFYSGMDIFVLPSIYEGFGIVLLEAMAAGIPVVASNVDGIKEIITNMKNGILVPAKNPEAIAEAVIRIIRYPELRNILIEEGPKRASLYDVREHIIKLDNLYTNLLGTESYK